MKKDIQTIQQVNKRSYFKLLFIFSTFLLLNSCYSDLEETTNEYTLMNFVFPEAELFDTKAYFDNSEYASTIEKSILIDGDYCTFGELPLIGMETDSPTIDDIMKRVVVSHDWMGKRFQEILETYPSEFLKLFGGVAAIVIDDDIRPSYYHGGTASIYLDVNYFWLSEKEQESVNPKLDYRSNYSNDLIFGRFYRYVKDNKILYRYISASSGYWPRKLEDIRLLVARLLLHELAHANDFFPPKLYSSFNRSEEPWSVATAHKEEWISERLNKDNPLSSDILKDIAQVSYHGETATDAQKNMTATDIGVAFELDGASDMYAYSDIAEDAAMLFEEAMMKYFFDVDRDMAFINQFDGNYDYIIRWGVRNRFSDPRVISRAEFVIKEILPDINFDEFMQNLPATKLLTIGVHWRDSLGKTSSNSNGNENYYEPELEHYIHYY